MATFFRCMPPLRLARVYVTVPTSAYTPSGPELIIQSSAHFNMHLWTGRAPAASA